VYDGIRNPYVLVINNVNFHYIVQPRTGAKSDERNVDAFVEEAGFKTVVKSFDLRKKEMLELLDKTQRDVALVDHDSFICFIMSHGNQEGILAADGQTIPVDDIMAKFQGGKCPYLATKPKLFFIQACRGDVDDEGYLVPRGPYDVLPDTNGIEEMPVKLPSEADFLVAYSTTKGHVSHRRYTDSRRLAAAHGRMLGSWFISCLVQILQKYSNREDLMTMLTRVNSAMCRLYTLPSGCKQISCQLSMLTKKVYFANYLEKESVAAAAV